MKRIIHRYIWQEIPSLSIFSTLLLMTGIAFAQTGSICKIIQASASGYVIDAPSCAFPLVSAPGAVVSSQLTFAVVSEVPAGSVAQAFSDLSVCDNYGSPPSAGATTITPCTFKGEIAATNSSTTTTSATTTTSTTTTTAVSTGTICKISLGSASGYVTSTPSCSYPVVGTPGGKEFNMTYSMVSMVPSGYVTQSFNSLPTCDPFGAPPIAGGTVLQPCRQVISQPVKVLKEILIIGPLVIDESTTSLYKVEAKYSDESVATVAANLNLMGSAALLKGNQLSGKFVTANQTVTINANYAEGGVSKQASLPVTIRDAFKLLTQLEIVGNVQIDEKSTSSFKATASYDDGSTKEVTPTWSSNAADVATISSSGILSANRVAKDTSVVLTASYKEGPAGYPGVTPVEITSKKDITIKQIYIDVAFNERWTLAGNGTNASWKVSDVFGDKTKVVTVWKWIADKREWAFYSPSLTTQELDDYALSHGYGRLESIDAGDGVWCNAATPFSISVPMKFGVSAKILKDRILPNWNLISVSDSMSPGEFNLAISPSALNEAPPVPGGIEQIPLNLVTLWAWDSNSRGWFFYAPNLDQQGPSVLSDYIARKGYIDFTATNKKLGIGVGFWVNKGDASDSGK